MITSTNEWLVVHVLGCVYLLWTRSFLATTVDSVGNTFYFVYGLSRDYFLQRSYISDILQRTAFTNSAIHLNKRFNR